MYQGLVPCVVVLEGGLESEEVEPNRRTLRHCP